MDTLTLLLYRWLNLNLHQVTLTPVIVHFTSDSAIAFTPKRIFLLPISYDTDFDLGLAMVTYFSQSVELLRSPSAEENINSLDEVFQPSQKKPKLLFKA